jgi:nitrite reductase (cytochrome c-552)
MVDDRGRAPTRRRVLPLLLVAASVGLLGALAGLFLFRNIMQRKQEARNPFYRVVELTDTTVDPAVWGRNFPLQYDDYRRTVDQQRTEYGGSEAEPHVPTQADPRSWVAQSRLAEDPRLKTMWAGYAFAKDFREERGHAYMLEDQTFTERQQVTQQPGTCLHCHASMYVPYRKAGNGDLIAGFEKVNTLPYQEARKLVTHPVACIDCHDPASMQLRVTRPGFLEGIAALKKTTEGIENYNPNTMATRQEMRTFVCGQCHVEYYFRGKEKRLVYPWNKGLKADSILSYYEENGHKDWVHAVTGAKTLKAQHPEFEMYNQGIHARSGVACADCHMPYKREGAMKISDHHVRSPLLNTSKACQTCHKWSEEELLQRAQAIQDRNYELRNMAMDALVELIGEIGAAARRDSLNASVQLARGYQRKAQFLLDFVEAENSMGFHAPQEAARILANSVNYTRMGQVAIRGGTPAPLKRYPAPQPFTDSGAVQRRR